MPGRGFTSKRGLGGILGPLGWITLVPLALLTGMLVFPILYTFWMSLHDWYASAIRGPMFVGLDNFARAFKDPRFLFGVVRTFGYTIGAVAFEGVLGLALALLLHREFRGRGLARALILLPMVATPVAISLVWLMMYDPATGVIGWALGLLGIPPIEWVNNPITVIPALVLVDIWQWTPLVTLICLAGLSALPTEPYESARIDGASGWQAFRFITLPLLRPALVIALLFRTIDALKWFDTIWVISRGGPGFASETLNIYIYKVAFEYFNMGYASALLVLFFAIVLGVSLLLIKLRRGAW